MGSVIVNVPYSSTFDYEEWAEYRQKVYGNPKWIWTEAELDHRRLPANIHIVEFLLYVETVFQRYLERIEWAGENILYSPAYPDIIYSTRSAAVTDDSPHKELPWSISYFVKRRTPASADPPFGRKKQWKYRNCGEFRDSNSDVWQLKSRWWENLIEFTAIANSGKEVDELVLLFEHFMELNERYFLEAGLGKIVPFGRLEEPKQRLDEAGIHYRSTLYWMLTQEFKYVGPITQITDINMDVDTTYTSFTGE